MINLNYRDSRPIYEQIKDGIRKLVVTGALSAGDKLPSVREFASMLAINPNTIQRAYRDLESEGYIYTTAGKGSFAADVSGVDTTRRAELLKSFSETVLELFYLGIGNDELKTRIDNLSADLRGKQND